MSDIKPEQLSDIYKEFCSIIGLESTILIYSAFKGQQISFPVRLISRDYTKTCIIKEFDGTNTKEMSKKYGYSERWIREITNIEKCK